MSTYLSAGASFGIYDMRGKLVVAANFITSSGLNVINQSGFLAGSRLYYTAWGIKAARGGIIRPANAADLPNCGRIAEGLVLGALPLTFNPAAIVNTGDDYPAAVTLYQVEELFPQPTPSPADIELLQPAGGEIFMAADFMQVSWRSNLNTAGSGVQFTLYDGSGRIADLGYDWNPAGQGQRALYLPLLPTREDYRVRVVSTWDQRLFDESEPIAISGQPLLVITPNGGEAWRPGSLQQIHWKSNTWIAGTGVSLELWQSGQKVADLGQDWDSDGESVRTVLAPLLQEGTNYRVRVISTWLPELFDESDQDITILRSPAAQPAAGSQSSVEGEIWALYN